MSQTIATHIELRTNRNGKPRAFIAGTRVRVQDIYAFAELEGDTPDQIAAALPSLTLAQIHAALSYYFDHTEEIRTAFREDQAFAESVRASLGEGPLAAKLKFLNISGDAISSG